MPVVSSESAGCSRTKPRAETGRRIGSFHREFISRPRRGDAVMRRSPDEDRPPSFPRDGARLDGARRLRGSNACRPVAALRRTPRRQDPAPRRAHDGEPFVRSDAGRAPGSQVRGPAARQLRFVSWQARSRRRATPARHAARLVLPRPASPFSQGAEADIRPRSRRTGGHGRVRSILRGRAPGSPDACRRRRAVHDPLRSRAAADPADSRGGICGMHALVQLDSRTNDAESNVRPRRIFRGDGLAGPLLLTPPRQDDLRPARRQRTTLGRLLPRRSASLDHGIPSTIRRCLRRSAR